MNTADILDKAADLIEERGLAKRVHCNRDGGLCAAGGMFAANGIEPVARSFSPEDWPTYNAEGAERTRDAYQWFGSWLRASGVDVRDAVTWNDQRRRTREDVVSTLRAAARAARAEQ